jgi:hypothetical protein
MKQDAPLGPTIPNRDPQADPREDSGSRWALLRRLKSAISSEHPAVTMPAAPETSGIHARPDARGGLDHERARQLLLAQLDTLLPPAEANALSAHLLTCDACYRFAQDIAAQRR